MKKLPMYIKYAIVMFVLCFPPISSTQLGWYFFGSEVGINIGMVVGVISVSVAAYLMYILGWRDADDDE
ncbi:hypothetical protein OAY16_05095 [Candidatus Pelagibacter sp.]|jgi:hypothetical protein|nr:hypothetical protein [Candidatus Pelagibacter ubique]ARJ49492.1 hypothetical protein B8063_05615 [Candidatus Pelagibacter sp. RS40]MDA9752572.1 hypothetical protein [Candidatus Pelagibacter sp.]MDC2969431.1 hypothetical protein [Candidatus Pelagibacter sp.]|tara:strand:+ start:978 stop:1184 length:207 start_codon:yes stop_codon:yes gene_type:complete